MAKITQKELNSGMEFRFENKESEDVLDVWFKDGGRNWESKYRMMFNGEQQSYKSLTTLNRNVNLLIEKYDLKLIEDEDATETD